MAVKVIGYLERCVGCGMGALLAEQPEGRWTCPACDGLVDGPPQPQPEPMERTAAILRLLFESIQAARKLKSEGALLDTVEALDDGDPEPGQLGREEG